MTNLIPVFVLLVGVAIGAVVTWLVFKSKATTAYQDGKAESATQLAAFNERLTAKDHELQRLHQSSEKETAAGETLRDQNSRLKAELEGERRAAVERHESFRRVTEELAEKFKALSRDALKDNNQSFLDLARATMERFQATAKGDLEQRQQAIDQLVKPLKDSLEKVDGKIEEMERMRAGAYSGLVEQVKTLAASQHQLQSETGNLVKAL